MKVPKSGGLYKGVTNFLKRMDFYGYKVQLHLKNDPEFKSTLVGHSRLSLSVESLHISLFYFHK